LVPSHGHKKWSAGSCTDNIVQPVVFVAGRKSSSPSSIVKLLEEPPVFRILGHAIEPAKNSDECGTKNRPRSGAETPKRLGGRKDDSGKVVVSCRMLLFLLDSVMVIVIVLLALQLRRKTGRLDIVHLVVPIVKCPTKRHSPPLFSTSTSSSSSTSADRFFFLLLPAGCGRGTSSSSSSYFCRWRFRVVVVWRPVKWRGAMVVATVEADAVFCAERPPPD
jgi:hypothetical protein